MEQHGFLDQLPSLRLGVAARKRSLGGQA